MELKKYLASISYDGSDYFGFAKSSGKATIQQEVEKALASLFKMEEVFDPDVKCASRTDAGVHALGQLIVFFLPFNMIPCIKLTEMINSCLPSLIKFNLITEVEESFTLYSCVLNKEYIYLLSRKPLSPFLSRYVGYFEYEFKFDRLRSIISLFEGEHDFSVFSKDSKQYKSTICSLFTSQVFLLDDKDLIVFHFKGNRFLYNMVRRLIGCALSLAASKIDSIPTTFSDFTSSAYLKFTTQKASPNGLYLLRVNLAS